MTDRTCAQCGGPMPPRVGRIGRPPAYCSTRCRLDAQHEREALWRVVGQAAVAAAEQRTIKESR